MRQAGEVQGTAAFGKFMRVLQAVADEPGAVNIAGLCRATGFPRSTTHRIVAALMAEGMLTEERRTGELTLGPRLISLGYRSWDSSDLRQLAAESIAALRNATGETVHLAVRSGAEMVYIDKLESPRVVRMTSRIGTRVPMHSSSVGKAYLAALPRAERDAALAGLELIRRTPHTITDRATLAAEIERTAERGYSIDGEETELDISCFGCAIVDGSAKILGCISVSIPSYRFDPATSADCVTAIRGTAHEIARRLAGA
jgi:DNA-binding IclR family transcriptional regulator